jgi:hypothetical protein
MFLKKILWGVLFQSVMGGGDIDIHCNITGCRHNFVSLFFQHVQNGNLQKCTITFTPCLSASVCFAVCVTTWETLNVFAWSFIFVRLTKICHIPHFWLKLHKMTGDFCKDLQVFQTTCCVFKEQKMLNRSCWMNETTRCACAIVVILCVHHLMCLLFLSLYLVFPKLIDSRTLWGFESTVRTHKVPGS